MMCPWNQDIPFERIQLKNPYAHKLKEKIKIRKRQKNKIDTMEYTGS